jgi:hypothetical protein
MLFSKQPFFCLSRTAFNQSSMAGKDARQTAMRGSGGHFNNPKFWLFLAIGDNFERFMVVRTFLGASGCFILNVPCLEEFFSR